MAVSEMISIRAWRYPGQCALHPGDFLPSEGVVSVFVAGPTTILRRRRVWHQLPLAK